MTNYLQFTTKDGDDFLVEVDTTSSTEEEKDGEVKASRVPDVVTKRTITRAQNTFDDTLDVVKTNAAAFIRKVKELPEQEQPAEMQMSFSLKATDELGGRLVVIGKEQAEASYTITLTWRK